MTASTTILEAAARLLNEGGVAALTTRGVAREAGVQAPTLYRLFGDKDGLLDAVAEHVMATYAAATSDRADLEAVALGDPVADLRSAWGRHVDFGLAHPELYALLSTPGRGESAAVRAGAEALRTRVRRVAAAGRLRVSEARAVSLIHAAGTGAVLATLAQPGERDLALAEAMLEAVLAAVLTDAPGDPVNHGHDADDVAEVASAVALRSCVGSVGGLSTAERGLMAEWLDRVIATAQVRSSIGRSPASTIR